jgi:hypothetical protein
VAGIFGGRRRLPRHSIDRGIRYFSPLLPSSLPRPIIVYANGHRRGGGLKQSSRNPALLSRSADFLCSIGERANHQRRRPTLTPKRRVIGIIRDPEPPRRRAAARCKVHGDRLNAGLISTDATLPRPRGEEASPLRRRLPFAIILIDGARYFNRAHSPSDQLLHIRAPPRGTRGMSGGSKAATASGGGSGGEREGEDCELVD